ncbi:MAG: extracellular solute-binding protein, partial [Clostridia bacterium]|nr:extracellular solute-binding protein [Clostridia bacterium]
MKKLVSLFLAVCCVGALVSGCNKAGNAAPTSSAAQSTAQAGSSAAVNTSKNIAISVMINSANWKSDDPWLALTIDAFEKLYPNVALNVTGYEESEEGKKLMIMAQSDSLPDIFWTGKQDARNMAKAGELADISQYYDSAWKARLLSGALDQFTFDGKQYGANRIVSAEMWYYNKALFDKYKLTIPTTWDQFTSDIKVFKQNGITPIAQSAKDNWAQWGYYVIQARYGFFSRIDNILAGKDKFDNPDFISCFTRLQELKDMGAYPSNISTITYNQCLDMFDAGKAAMINTGTWDISKMDASSNAGNIVMNWGPTFTGSKYPQNISSKVYGTALYCGKNILKDQDKVNAIIAYFKYKDSNAGCDIILNQAKCIPCVKLDQFNPDISKLGPVTQKTMTILNDSVPTIPDEPGVYVTDSSFIDALWNSFAGVETGTMTPKQAMDALDTWNAN